MLVRVLILTIGVENTLVKLKIVAQITIGLIGLSHC